jgi:hypothetical protein
MANLLGKSLFLLVGSGYASIPGHVNARKSDFGAIAAKFAWAADDAHNQR